MTDCPRLLNLLLSPGNYESPDGPCRAVSLRCLLPVDHDGRCSFEEDA